MTNRRFKRFILLFMIIAIPAILLFIWFKGVFFTFDGIQAEHFEVPIDSPEGTYTAHTYYEYYGGAAGGVNAVVEITDHTNADSTKIIYYADAQSQVNVEWEDEQTLYIINKTSQYPKEDRSISLNVNSDIYHDTGLACRSILLKNTYTNCFYKQ
ncbi:hypothetical protein D3C73_758810 [compost metagenome]